jgi:RimJ/RimL family protein N-acetyltransferase
LNAFEQLPGFAWRRTFEGVGLNSAEFGMIYEISPGQQRRRYGTEAAQALVDYAFKQLHLGRVVAETTFGNLASMGVMRKLGMRILRNPHPEPPWLQVVGLLENHNRPST